MKGHRWLRIAAALACALAAASLTLGLVAAVGWPVWQEDGVGLCVATDAQENPQIVSDGSGGAIVTWQDFRGSGATQWGIYAQRVYSDGTPAWATDGVSLSTVSTLQQYPQIVSDGSGGAIATWQDARSGGGHDIYAQRVYSDGTTAWTTGGVGLCTDFPQWQQTPQIASDGYGGAIVTWQDNRNSATTGNDIYAQRVDSNGNALWQPDGVSLTVAPRLQQYPQIVPDGAGGAIVTWQDYRTNTNWDIYARRVYSNGTVAWATDGVSLCVSADHQESPQIASDGSGGAIVTWKDERDDFTTAQDIYAQRVDGLGESLWYTDGVSVCAFSATQSNPQIASDGSGGAIVVWQDYRNSNYDIYAQRLDADGNKLWADSGVPVCVQPYEQGDPQIASDGSGGAMLTWFDKRNGEDYNIYAQRIDSSGQGLWQNNGVLLCAATLNQRLPQIVPDGAGGAIVTWYDYRNPASHYDIYVQRVGDLSAGLRMPLVLKRHQ